MPKPSRERKDVGLGRRARRKLCGGKIRPRPSKAPFPLPTTLVSPSRLDVLDASLLETQRKWGPHGKRVPGRPPPPTPLTSNLVTCPPKPITRQNALHPLPIVLPKRRRPNPGPREGDGALGRPLRGPPPRAGPAAGGVGRTVPDLSSRLLHADGIREARAARKLCSGSRAGPAGWRASGAVDDVSGRRWGGSWCRRGSWPSTRVSWMTVRRMLTRWGSVC